ncbi:hypothetical protein N7468_001820 [Penicillium chermesinum]|uniref:CWH43-like N-terminal domain-containing protein n=1 Tax=Penicillium chermesinum TaxID=63820 RepID=A0A9W9PK89_9EURO|nr:uncharacterized protein N7468_001820 [Penicillium chermesinum]KAJ5246837.1 hypothetical protein N7468_001820 [Penicillium chermesinum]KAJ6145096.1 hypothetical protein N7470_008991 [Penicillium chermesinum]
MLAHILWLFPIISASTWLTMLCSMLGHWVTLGEPRYGRMRPGQTIPFISDIGAGEYKPIFMTGSIVSMFFLNLSFYQFLQRKAHGSQACTYLSFIFSIIGSLGLVLLSFFDNLDYLSIHDSLVAVFMTGFLLSAAIICIEYFYYRMSDKIYDPALVTSFAIKSSFVIVELVFIFAFRVTAAVGDAQKNAAAVLEWVVAFIFTGYIISFAVDLRPSPALDKRTDTHHEYQQLEMDMGPISRIMI